MKYILISLLFFIIGCGLNSEEQAIYNTAMMAPLNYKCSKEQDKKVQDETKFCVEVVKYKPHICYGLSIIKHCDKIKKEINK